MPEFDVEVVRAGNQKLGSGIDGEAENAIEMANNAYIRGEGVEGGGGRTEAVEEGIGSRKLLGWTWDIEEQGRFLGMRTNKLDEIE
jgi:hypothetical protein